MFIECTQGTSGRNLATAIEKACRSVNLDMSKLRGQGYDGAANMAGRCSGAAKLILCKYPKALYSHCASHKLNLCIVQACKLSCVSNIAKFFNLSPKRQQYLEEHVQQYCDSLNQTIAIMPECGE